MRASASRIVGAVLLAWCLATALSALTNALGRERDDRSSFETEIAALAADLPPHGNIGYVDAGTDGEPSDAAVHLAQYALAPRVIVAGAGPEYLVVRSAAASHDAHPVSSGYEAVGPPVGSHRVYRRTR